MNPRRPEREEYLRQLGLDPGQWDPVSELAAPFNLAHSNRFEAFPDIVPDGDGRFRTQFVVHRLRHTNPHSIERTESREVGEELRLSLELNNPATGHAVTARTADHYVIGWLPPRTRMAVGSWRVTKPEWRDLTLKGRSATGFWWISAGNCHDRCVGSIACRSTAPSAVTMVLWAPVLEREGLCPVVRIIDDNTNVYHSLQIKRPALAGTKP